MIRKAFQSAMDRDELERGCHRPARLYKPALADSAIEIVATNKSN